MEETESEDDSSITGKLNLSLVGGRAPGVAEIHPELPKALEMPVQHRVEIWGSATGLADSGGGSQSSRGGMVGRGNGKH